MLFNWINIFISLFITFFIKSSFTWKPRKPPFQIGQDELQRLRPLFFAVELNSRTKTSWLDFVDGANYSDLLDWIRISGRWIFNLSLVHPVWQTESWIASLNFLLELLETVKKSDHSCIELRVPEEPKTSTAVQWQLLLHFAQHFDVRMISVWNQIVALEGQIHFAC